MSPAQDPLFAAWSVPAGPPAFLLSEAQGYAFGMAAFSSTSMVSFCTCSATGLFLSVVCLLISFHFSTTLFLFSLPWFI